MKTQNRLIGIAVVLCSYCASNYTKAQMIFEDNFNYSGNLNQNGWTAYSGVNNTALSTTDGLSYQNYCGSNIGNAANIRSIDGQDVYIPFSTRQLIYASFLVHVTESSTSTKTGYVALFGKRNNDNSLNSQHVARVIIKYNANGTWNIGTTNWALTNSDHPPNYSTTSFEPNKTYLVYMKFNITNNFTCKLWVKSAGVYTTEMEAGPPDVTFVGASSTAALANTVDAFALRQAPESPALILDGLKLYDSWDPATLPLTLLQFEAMYNSNKIQLKWTTEQEINVSHFEIEKSADAKNFHTIANIPATNNTNRNYYLYDDHTLTETKHFYRLKCVDLDKKYKYSNIITIHTDYNEIKIGILGNKNFIVFHPIFKQDIKCAIFNINGIIVSQLIFKKFQDRSIFNLQNFPIGIYWLKIQDYEINISKMFTNQ